MNGIIRISGNEWIGRTIAEMIDEMTVKSQDASLWNRPLLIVRNGAFVDASSYRITEILENDEITVMPFTAGG